MNKLLQIGLISTIMATSGFASSMSGLPAVIEAGATVKLYKGLRLLCTNVSNYGTITNEAGTALTIATDVDWSSDCTITNMLSAGITEVEEGKDEILAANQVNDSKLTGKVHQITYSGGSIGENIEEGFQVTFATDDTAPTLDPSSLAGTDLLYLGEASESGKTVKIAGDLNCPLGNQPASGETTNSYEIEISGNRNINGDISNYKDGKITVTSGRICLNATTEINSPIDVSGGDLYTNAKNIDIYSDITIYSGGVFWNESDSLTLKSGATLTIGATADE